MRTAILDHGYVEAVEHWGSDERIIESARMSTSKGFLGWGPVHAGDCSMHDPLRPMDSRRCTCQAKPGDEKLLRYLYENKHSTPFEFAGLTIEVQAPIMVFREWHRHRTQSFSELSARYTPLPDSNYMPSPERCLVVNATNKQAGKAAGSGELTHEDVIEWLVRLSDVYDHAESVYQHGLRIGIPKELARLPVPVGRYSRMRATGNLRNWLAFMTLRSAPSAQWEIRQFSDEVGAIVARTFPRTWQLFAEGRAS